MILFAMYLRIKDRKQGEVMCGIAGICNPVRNGRENMKVMLDRMQKRGPDDEGMWQSEKGDVIFGHRRLSIVDLSANGSQPMSSHSGRYEICYNGEMYNFKEISDRLISEKKVERFNGSSDTEVLIEAIEAYGLEDTLGMCKGMFAFAIYDNATGEMYLSRDRVGEKPLYYGFAGDSFVFASDIASIAELEWFDNEIDRDVLSVYFIHGYIPAPYSIYKGIHKLTPGTILKINSPFNKTDDFDIRPFWSIMDVAKRGQDHPFQGTREEAADELERLLKLSIKDQMVADVPVGAFLSAGIDSSTVVALMQSLAPGKVRTFTIGMTEKGYNEADVAKEIASHLGTEHTELYISEEDALKVVPDIAHMFGEPFADSSQIPTYLVSRMTREHVTVSLSGDAGDELFGGYTSYQSVDRIWKKIKGIPLPLRKAASSIVLHTPAAKNDVMRIKGTLLKAKDPGDLYRISAETEDVIGGISLDKNECPYCYTQYPAHFMNDTVRNVMLMDMMMYHPDDILVKVDRTAMAVSLETRVPMLDRDVVEFAWSLPMGYLINGATGKQVLRDVLYRYVPKEMMDRPKKGFSIPIDRWLREPGLRKWAEMLIDKNLLEKQGLLDPEVVWRIWDDFIERGIWRIQIWYILMFQEWLMSECPASIRGRL